MKKWRAAIISLVMGVLMISTTVFSACFFDECGDSDKQYTVQYSFEDEVYTLQVRKGDVWAIETVPEKYGYKFLGLYDAETDGKQYVLPSGSSVSEFTGKKNLVLYPQFKANEYNVILDYQDADNMGVRSLKAEYDAELPTLPEASKNNYNFLGWFTKAGGKGVKVADKDGLIPTVSVVNKDNFNLEDKDANIYLYAAFTIKTYSVTYHFGNGIKDEVCEVEHGKHITEAVPSTRNSAGEAVLVWNDAQGHVFDGYITSDIEVYAKEFAPVIELNVNGGDKIAPVIARVGTAVTLPVPTKSHADFLRWEDSDGTTAEITVMPAESTSLKAIWREKIEFDVNGGSTVQNITVAAGTAITLPKPQKDGYIFAGWYTEDGEYYTTNKMPETGVGLKAGWYTAREKNITVVENNTDKKLTVDTNTMSTKHRVKIDLSDIFQNMGEEGVEINYTLDFRWGNTYKYCTADAQIALYEGSEFNSAYRLNGKSLSHSDDRDSYLKDSISGTSVIHNDVLYMYYSGAGKLHISLSGGYGNVVAFYDVNLKLTYPDITKLYL